MAIKRRNFLRGMAAVTASSLIQPEAERAQETAPQEKYHYSKLEIDGHFHWYGLAGILSIQHWILKRGRLYTSACSERIFSSLGAGCRISGG
jgi:hypothetical protein